MGFFLQPVLRNGHGRSAGRYRPRDGQLRQCVSRHVFKFSGDGGAQRGQLCQTGRVAVAGLNVMVADQPGRALRVGIKHGGEVAQALRGMHKHTAQLAAAHHAQRGARQNGCRR